MPNLFIIIGVWNSNVYLLASPILLSSLYCILPNLQEASADSGWGVLEVEPSHQETQN